MAATPTTRYVRSDDVHVAYQVIGDGPLDLLWVPGYVSHVEAAWQSPQHAAFIRRLASFSRLILFDKRGTGMSDRGSQIFTLEQRMHDVRAILDEIGSERAALFGVSEGGPMSLLYAATYPERTSALVLYGSYAKRSWAPDYPFGWKAEQWERVLANINQNWGTPQGTNIAMYAPSLMDKPDEAEQVASYFRASASPGAAAAIMKMNREIDVRNVLPAVRAPTMIIHRTGDRVSEVGHARYMAEQIAGATLAELPGIDHAYWIDGGKVILDQIERFLTGRLPAHEPERMLATVLFADIVGSTEWVAKLGDGPWRELLGTFHRKVREVLQQYRGREINTTGDGFLVAFDGPARAVRCAAAIRDAVHPLGLEVRCGLHTGECEIVGNDLAGIAVHIGARVGGLAGPGEVLVSQTVRDLVAGSGLAFEPCGTHVLKGVPSEWRLFRAVAPLSTPRKSRRRCTPESGHGSDRTRCSLSANSRRRSAIRLPRRRMKGIHGDLKQFTRRGRRLAPHCRTDTSFNLGDSLRFASRPVSASLHAGLKIWPTNCLLAVFSCGSSATRRRRDLAFRLASATIGTSFAAAVVQPNFVCPTFLNTVIEAPLEIAGPTSRATTARPSIGSACHRHTDYRGQHWRHRQK